VYTSFLIYVQYGIIKHIVLIPQVNKTSQMVKYLTRTTVNNIMTFKLFKFDSEQEKYEDLN